MYTILRCASEGPQININIRNKNHINENKWLQLHTYVCSLEKKISFFFLFTKQKKIPQKTKQKKISIRQPNKNWRLFNQTRIGGYFCIFRKQILECFTKNKKIKYKLLNHSIF